MKTKRENKSMFLGSRNRTAPYLSIIMVLALAIQMIIPITTAQAAGTWTSFDMNIVYGKVSILSLPGADCNYTGTVGTDPITKFLQNEEIGATYRVSDFSKFAGASRAPSSGGLANKLVLYRYSAPGTKAEVSSPAWATVPFQEDDIIIGVYATSLTKAYVYKVRLLDPENLSAFTIGGQDCINLSGAKVTTSTRDDFAAAKNQTGATLNVTNASGVVATAHGWGGTTSMKLYRNDSEVAVSNWATVALQSKDVIVMQWKDGPAWQFYKVTLEGTTNTPVTGVSLNKASATLTPGQTEPLTATVAPADATNTKVTWASSNTAIAAVDSNGLVTAVAPGTADINVTTEDGGFTAVCAVSVKAGTVPVTGVSLNKHSAELTVGQTDQLNVTIAPADATNTKVTWASSNTAVAAVDNNGLVTAVAPGTADIMVTTADGGFTDKCIVTVKGAATIPVTGVSLNKTAATLSVGKTEQLTATVAPANATNAKVTWKSSNTAIAAVDNNGQVTAVAAGTANITVTTVDGGFTATCSVTVTKPVVVRVKGVVLNRAYTTIDTGKTEQLVATITPTNATNKNVTWLSSIPQVATVDSNGLVTAVAPGITRIKVTTVDGGFTAYCTVMVKIALVRVTGISLNKDTIALTSGKTEQLTATVTPTNAALKTVIWTSSNCSVATVINGRVVGLLPGTATITATTVDGGFNAACTVTVTSKLSFPKR